jgi:hypothetical protein
MTLKERYYHYKGLATGGNEWNKEIVGTLASGVAVLFFLPWRKSIWTWFAGLITDGYFLVLASPLILVYWSALVCLILLYLGIWSILWIVATYWTFLIELPAGVLNKESLNFLRSEYASEGMTISIVVTLVVTILVVGITFFTIVY